MPNTSMSLLERLRSRTDEEAWERLVALYTPLIRNWMQLKFRLSADDADDLVQDVLGVVFKRVGDFERQRVGSFRAWLKTITVHCLRNFLRQRARVRNPAEGSELQSFLQQLEDPRGDLSLLWDREHDEHVMRTLLEQLRPQFTDSTWTLFQRVALESTPAEVVAAEQGVTVNAVFIAKSRVLAKLRQEVGDLLD